MATHDVVVNVLYGTVTGNAEQIARRIHAELPDRGFTQGLARCLSHYADVPAFVKPPAHPNTYNVIVVSTTGDGDPPDTIRPFMKLTRSKDTERLSGLNFTILALGDTNYENFCKTGKRIDEKLPKLGANRFLKRADADDGIGLELIVEPWIENLWTELARIADSQGSPTSSLSSSDEAELIDTATTQQAVVEAVQLVTEEELGFDRASLPPVLPPKFALSVVPDISDISLPLSVHPCYDDTVVRTAMLHHARLLTDPSSDKTVWHIDLLCQPSANSAVTAPTYRPGDAFGVLVENDSDEVDRFFRATGIDKSQVLSISESPSNSFVSSVASLVSQRIDLRAIPSKTLLRSLSEYCETVEDRRNLLHLCSRKGRSDYTSQISRAEVTVLHLLEELAPSCKPTINVLLDQVPALAPRWYSTASSPELDGDDHLHFAFSVVKHGLATNSLARRCKAFLAGETTKPILLLPRDSDSTSLFKSPSELSTSYVMVGPGTGVAPFRGFLRERQARMEASTTGRSSCGNTMLFFGCRNKTEDFLYEDDLQGMVANGTLSVLDVAFSREEDVKVYVQNKLVVRKKEVAEIIESGGCVFVCGDGGGMAVGVHKALTEIVTDELCNGDADSGRAMMKSLAEEHRYVRDIWYHG